MHCPAIMRKGPLDFRKSFGEDSSGIMKLFGEHYGEGTGDP